MSISDLQLTLVVEPPCISNISLSTHSAAQINSPGLGSILDTVSKDTEDTVNLYL